ncbi:MFS transporter [Streptomyces avicenniae]|uniref:MFS transporter n=1 Tax=Streptomyces avicenniae TaxID=500153 RepID=UPI000A64B8EB|nr:MFS transporter [Streptomyces avicenniae]
MAHPGVPAAPPAPPAPPRTPRPSRALALAVLCAGTLMTILDGSIVTVALPAIRDDLGFGEAGLSWTVNAYLIPFGGLLLLAGRLGDLLGRRRMFLYGTALFTAASALAGAATSPAALLAGRFLQGVGSAMATAVSLGILVSLFREPGERGRAIAAFSFTGAVGASLGQVLGGVLTEAVGWHWIFFINLPIGAAVLALAVRAVPADRGSGLAAGADLIGALLITAGLMLGILTLVETDSQGWTSTRTLSTGAVAVALLAAFFARQATARTPLLPLRLFRSRVLVGANVTQMLMVAAMFSFQIVLALHLQTVLDLGAAGTGFAMLPAAAVIGVASLGASARLSARFGHRAVVVTGLLMLTALLVLLARVPADADYATRVLPPMLLTAGFGLAIPAVSALGMSGAREDDAGLVSGLFNTAQQVGAALGVAVLTTLAASRTEHLLADGQGRAAALTGGHQLAFGIGAALTATAALLALTVLRNPSVADRTTEEVSS